MENWRENQRSVTYRGPQSNSNIQCLIIFVSNRPGDFKDLAHEASIYNWMCDAETFIPGNNAWYA